MLSTTALFVEIVIIGIGGFGAALLLFFGLFCIPIPPNFWQFFPFMVAPALALDYIIGNIVDRLADGLTKWFDDRNKKNVFGKDGDKDGDYKNAYSEARTWVYLLSEPARSTFEYGKSRIRVFRGWVLNAPILAFSSWVFISNKISTPELEAGLIRFFSVFFLLIFVLTSVAWRNLSLEHFRRMKAYYEKMKMYRPRDGSEFNCLAIRRGDSLPIGCQAASAKSQHDNRLLGESSQTRAPVLSMACVLFAAIIFIMQRGRRRPT